jgi:hypothetical protein
MGNLPTLNLTARPAPPLPARHEDYLRKKFLRSLWWKIPLFLISVAALSWLASPAGAQSYQRGYEEMRRRYNAPTYVHPPQGFVIPSQPQVYFPPTDNWRGHNTEYYQPDYRWENWQREREFRRQQALEERRWQERQRLARQREWEIERYSQPRRQGWSGQGNLPHTTPTSRQAIRCHKEVVGYNLSPPEWSFSLNVTTCFDAGDNVSGFFHQGRWYRFLS